jgi:fibronectin type 3 domain-containing protein
MKQSLYILLLLVFPAAWRVAGQDTMKVALRVNVKPDRIQLRWAAGSSATWRYANQNGFTVVRHTIVRDSIPLDIPEKTILTLSPLKPRPLDDWQHIAQADGYAAIIAQALYGSDFEVEGGQAGISQIIALSQEQEQRYAMSLVAADLSFPAAVFAGWGMEDTTVRKGEKYLYQVFPANAQGLHVENGSAYSGPDDATELPRPLGFTALWGNGSVLLTWDYKLLLPWYNSYHVERSYDGVRFSRLSKTPLINIMGNDRMFHTDSIVNGITCYYRLLGVTPFGDESAPSDTLYGTASGKLVHVPFIRQVLPDGAGGVDVMWEFDEQGEDEITGFELRRSTAPDGAYVTAVADIPSDARNVNYPSPLPESYLTLAAIPREGAPTVSLPRLLQMEDTIPPAIPRGLTGYVDTLGVAHLSWESNAEPDVYGYRIYRAQTQGEELIPLNDDAHRATGYTDTVDIRNLNARVYYAVASLDMRYNQSALSETLELEKPDVIKPSPPFITRYESDGQGVFLQWTAGREETVRSFRIYRREKDSDEPLSIAETGDATVFSYLDTTAIAETDYLYTVTAATRNGTESDGSPEIEIRAKGKETDEGISQFTAQRTEQGIVLAWRHTVRYIRSIAVYRREGEKTLSLWREPEAFSREITDTAAQRDKVYEYMLVIKNRQGKVFSKTGNIK